MKKTYPVEVDCANCASKMEEAVKGTPGVASATLNFMALKLKVEFEDGADEGAVMKEALRRCRRVESDCDIIF
ncbi:MAG: cation transporter [Clostridia bacterium]|nr:cation transporter [Clostridia bacterium]